MKSPATPPGPALRPAHRHVAMDALRDGGATHRPEALAVEEPLEIRLLRQGTNDDGAAGRPAAIVLRTPGHDIDLALGFLHGEGIVRSREDVIDVRPAGADGNVLRVIVRQNLPLDLKRLERNVYATSNCGVCGKGSIDALTSTLGLCEVRSDLRVPERLLSDLPDRLFQACPDAAPGAGGMHAAGLFDAEGGLLAGHVDVGRHNALDKLTGAALRLGDLPWSRRIVLLTGRVSFELVQKVMMAGAPVLAALGAPSTLAVDLAQAAGITLVGGIQRDGCDVYTHPVRIGHSPRL
jgi:FdhD protein